MCGIFASVGFEPDRRRISIVAHRGPDGEGWEVMPSPAGPVALGHRRLAIIDISHAADQPMHHAPSGLTMVFNGEIYNYIELRAELAALGERFTTDSDSEVLLRAFAVWGEDALPKLRGMFAFVVHDARRNRLFAARDRFGIKPLYLAETPRGIALASEIKQLLGLPGLEPRMNVHRIHDFLSAGILDHTAETMFAGVRQLRGGERLSLDLSRTGAPAEIRRWYEITVPQIGPISEGEAAERFRALLTDSVRLHLRADVPVGSCLSGGLDSSAIVCLMAPMLAQSVGMPRVNSISACYADQSVDEKQFADIVVNHTGANSHLVYPRADDVFQQASDITYHQDEPFGSTSIFAQWCVFAEAKRAGIKVMLDGQGADEQLAGYHSSFGYYGASLAQAWRFGALYRMIQERHKWHGTPIAQQIRQFVVPMLPRPLAFVLRNRYAANFEHDWLNSDLFKHDRPQRAALDTAAHSLGLQAPKDIASLSVVLTHASNLQMLLHWEDRNSMAHSVEARVPFLDHALVEFCLGLGGQHKIVGGDTKRVLRAGMSGILPDAIRDRRDKLGFSTPETNWFRGPLRGAVLDGVENTLNRLPEVLNPHGTRALVADMLDGKVPVDFRLWRVISLGLWSERFGVSG